MAQIDDLIKTLHDTIDGAARLRIARQVVATGADAIPALCDLLRDPAVEVRRVAARALVDVSDPAAAPALIGALNDRDPMVQLDAVTALGTCRTEEGKIALLKLASQAHHIGAANVQAIRSLGWFHDARVVSHLLPLLAHSNGAIRLAAAEALGDTGDADALPALVERLESDPQIEIRWQAATSLGLIAAPEAVPALIAALRDTEPSVRTHAANALGAIQDRRAINPLRGAASDANERVRDAAARALIRLETKLA